MKNLSEVVRENRAEAIDIVKGFGGRMEFVDGIIVNNPDNYEEDDFNGDVDDLEIPYVLSSDDYIEEYAILAVVYDKDATDEDCLMFMAYSFDKGRVIGWIYDFSCSYNTENEVYMHINSCNEFRDEYGLIATDDNYMYSTDPSDYHKHFKDADDAASEIYAIYLNENCNTHLFDVVEADFIRLSDLGFINTEGSYYLLKPTTMGMVKQLRKHFGCCFDDILEGLKC